MIKHICIIANGYPTKDDPQYAFIQPVAHAFVDAGIQCTVIAAQSITKTRIRGRTKRAYTWKDKTEKGNTVTVFQPRYVSFSTFMVGSTNISALARDNAVIRCYQKEDIQADVIYAHFWECGVVAALIGNRRKIPVFVASGESKIWVRNLYSDKRILQMKESIIGLICVSSKNLEESRQLNLIEDNVKTIVLPNGFDPRTFYKIDQMTAREHLKISHDSFVGIFVGAFCERKGSERVIEAAKAIPELKLIMIGEGELTDSEQIIFKGKVPHDNLVWYLNAADFFILPTLAEGCCNAIVEALACGLPVISSFLSFNKDILDDNNSIRVDPSHILDIEHAILTLKQDKKLRIKLSRGTKEIADRLTIAQRANNIISFINEAV